MPIIAWNPAWEMNEPVIDAQHHALVDQMNALVDALSTPGAGDQTERALMYLSDYVENHFGTEEGIMERTGFPHLEEHRAAHTELRDRVRAMVAEQGWSLSTDIMNYLTDWLVNHLCSYDRALAKHLNP
ncbi:MAG TPA: bacteriohemerythrin [Holophaga sp.]|nr:bacteriohemerythrin [Holophaga sp.]